MSLLHELNEQRWQSPRRDDKELLDWLDRHGAVIYIIDSIAPVVIGRDARAAIRHARAQKERTR